MEGTRYGFAETEEAMFIVRGDDGNYRFVRWSSTGVPHEARWTRPLPRGAVAIVHTHPNWRPHPSRIDARTARRTRLDVYVVTATRISKTNGEEARTVVAGEWRP